VKTAAGVLTAPRQQARAIVAAGLIIVCFAAWLAFQIPKGILTNTDELLTAERTREMLLTEPWVVHFNFKRSFEKPPLQYWLTMLTLPRFENRTLAVRIWPLAYATLTAIALAWLAFLVEPERPWLIPLGAAVLVSSPLFSAEASRALLDIGLAFFTTIAIVFAQLARKHPPWWLGVAVTCSLGSLQKIPLIFLVWLLIVIIRICAPFERRALLNGWLIASAVLAIVASAVWPLVQLLKYHMAPASVFHEEVVVWLGPEYLGARPYLEIPFRLSTTAWISGGLFALVAPFAVLLWKKQRFSPAVTEIAILCIAVIALAVLFNFRSARYIVPILPCLCLLLTVVLYRLLAQRAPIRTGTAALLTLILIAGFVQSEVRIYLGQRTPPGKIVQGKLRLSARGKKLADEKRVAEELGALQQPGTRIVLVKAVKGGGDSLYDSFYLFHGNLRFPVSKLTVSELRQAPPSAPVIGVCVQRNFPVVREVYPNVEVKFTRAQFILWRVNAE
jgi:4-amino-4-deoxy-L-arabinose transferase-like glycosyltransferase